MFTTRLYSVFHLVFGTGILLAASMPGTFAADGGSNAYPALPVCDPNYYQTLREKGWMEAMREVQVNNTVITKPASVLALSCFDAHVKQITSGGSIFTDTGDNPSDVDDAIDATIGSSFTNYIKDSFKEPSIGSGMEVSASGGSGDCARLWNAWEKIKCAVVDNSGDNGGFLMSALDQHRTNAASSKDVRGSTGTPTCEGVVPSSRYEDGMKSSSDLVGTGKKRYGSDEDAKKYFSFVHPNFCAYDPKTGGALEDGKICKLGSSEGKSCKDMPAVPTGLVVAYAGSKADKDAFDQEKGTLYWTYRCLNPGCYFDVKANASSIKFSSGGTAPAMKCSPKPYETEKKAN